MVNNLTGWIKSKTVRMMCYWGRFSFRQALIHKAEHLARQWRKLVILREDCIPKSCNECGRIRDKLETSEVFKWP